MSESVIELARIEVQAISVKVRPDPQALEKIEELMLQANADGTVQVDAFGTDPQGNAWHVSRALEEQAYENMRQRLLIKEQASLPPFSSFKSGNTLGRVVGEAAPAAVPAAQANPRLKPEAEPEEDWWAEKGPWVHGGLDVLGFVPGLGAIPDLINAGIYAVEGDAVNAGLSAAAVIPFAGDALKGGVLVGKSANRLGSETVQRTISEATDKAARDGSKQAEKAVSERIARKIPEKRTAEQLSAPKTQDGAKIRSRNTTHTRNGYTYQLDHHGRVTKVEGSLKLNKSKTRNQSAQKNAGGKDRLPDDQGGHYVGRRFDGPTDEMNHFAQNGNFNNSAYRKLENSWEKALKNNKDVRIEINPRYTKDSLRPDKITIRQWIDGVEKDSVTYANKYGG
ncbi:hypothetical protein DM813_27075 [Pseudomonas alkylphenolica]|uniref:Type VII secretion system protein EssD-like domain-containing protein n=1 Tax=Pseudomonas alkylphenolica TaxID=237609 RepID=A0A443ZEC3_9PSED|nr:DNA/RNA non-specific endonuclease [Pseudomonas alkylphenolica]RWU17030.1 hypothetical protein DM813_27075 [Pseudomonas alkylphenolica]